MTKSSLAVYPEGLPHFARFSAGFFIRSLIFSAAMRRLEKLNDHMLEDLGFPREDLAELNRELARPVSTQYNWLGLSQGPAKAEIS